MAKLQLPLPVVTRPRVDHNRTRVYRIEETGFWSWVPFTNKREPLFQDSMKKAQELIEFASSKQEEAERAKHHAESVITLFFRQFGWDVQIEWMGETSPSVASK